MKSIPLALAGACALVATLASSVAYPQQANACLSTNPADWPQPARPYFMLVADTSGSMTACTTPPTTYPTECNRNAPGYALNSCNFNPSRMNDAKCALRKTVLAFGGEVNFGLGTYGSFLDDCGTGACPSTCGAPTGGNCSFDILGCDFNLFPGASSGCGNFPDCSGGTDPPSPPNYAAGTWRNGSNIVVPLAQDPWWLGPPPPPDNTAELLKWFDGQCDEDKELFAGGPTPIAGALQGATQHLRAGWSMWSTTNYCSPLGYTAPTPMDSQDRACRSVNVILVTDGDENCDSQAAAVAAASDLFNNGVTLGGKTWRVPVYVINFAGGNQAATDAIALAGGTTSSLFATNEQTLSVALSNIISGAIEPEVCNNADDNCNGCIDEGYRKFCNRNKTASANPTQAGECCQWSNQTQRNACIATWQGTVSGANPTGDQWELPCWDPDSPNPGGLLDEEVWLCADPGEICDELDNNCDEPCTGSPPGVSCGFTNTGVPPNEADEGFNKCPLCPTAETCDGTDENCDGIIDNDGTGVPFSICPGGCQSSPEICDGCDNDCDGIADDDIPPIACGFPNPPNCSGTRDCAPIPVANPGDCDPGGNTFGPCNNDPQNEVCNGLDDNCNGLVDEGLPSTPCNAAGDPGTWVYNDTFPESQCQRGQMPCNGSCEGAIGPSEEICDGVDNDCDGVVDENVPGVGQTCGTSTGACSPGTSACVGGVIVCTGGTQAQPEVCNGIDDDCDGTTDEPVLTDAPTEPGCWSNPGSGCGHQNAQWDPPSGGTCTGVGTLTTPCQTGALQCQGVDRWVCVGDRGPLPETCDGVDNDCDGTVDEGVPPPGTSCGTDVGVCELGTQACVGGVLQCQGGVTPSAEVCDGDDDDCDGVVDGTIPPSGPTSCTQDSDCAPGEACLERTGPADKVCAIPPPGTGVTCGTDVGACTTGTTVCTGGAIVCSGNTGPQPEVCDGVDNDCDGAVDDGPLQDAPADLGCWQLPGACCSGGGITWCPPAGGTCTGNGSLTVPCGAGSLVCTGAGGWACQGAQGPSPEVCDSLDNDCNGSADDGNPGGGAQCGNTDVGACELGQIDCVGGNLVCQGEVGPSPEICNDVDDDCDGTVDDDVPGVGNACGLSTGLCSKGATACVGGTLVCQGGTTPAPEVCNGLDDDCNGFTDDGMLGDAPPNKNCWDIPGSTCGYANESWDPPPGGNCTGLGTLTAPCATGQLVCDGVNFWSCVGGLGPSGEICDGVDNDCDGTVDDGSPGGGEVCGSDVGECEEGTTVCVGGLIDCQGETGPQPETCDGLDNDCDGNIDNGIPIGGSCQPLYDTAAYPGDRTQGICRPGQNECDGAGGLNCVGGVGPTPEICDGIDNDCDGQVDEPGAPPDGVNGTPDPQDPARNVGDPCGVDEGECREGALACVNGSVVCLGSVGPQPEQCDCRDNDCDGVVDEIAGAGDPPLCSPGKTCIDTGDGCQCASPCKSGEFPCPTGTECQTDVPQSGTGQPAGDFCVDRDPCGDCAAQTRFDGQGSVVCVPEGTMIGGRTLPPCVCKGQFGCQSPCFNIDCPDGQDCVPTGPATGTCQPSNNCNFFGCPEGRACHNEACVDNPCVAGACAADQVCKPTSTFDEFECVGSCAGVDCGTAQKCENGSCVDTGCASDCGPDEYCLAQGDAGFGCGPSRCTAPDGGLPCSNGAHCDPLTGACGDDPCAGVLCPVGQECAEGECIESEVDAGAPDAGVDGSGTGGSGGGGSGGGAPDASVGATGGTGGAGTPVKQDRRVWGLATGGGGCACRTSTDPRAGATAFALGLLVLGAAFARRRRRRPDDSRAERAEVPR